MHMINISMQKESLQSLFGGTFEHLLTVNGCVAHYRQELGGKIHQWKIERTTTGTIIAKMDFWEYWETVMTINRKDDKHATS